MLPYLAAATRPQAEPDPGVVHAPGGSLAARVPGAAGAAHACWQACFDAELVSEITLQPVRRHGVDAAILFSDIVVPLRAAGIELDIVPDVGPVIEHPIRTAADVAGLKPLEPENGFRRSPRRSACWSPSWATCR